MNPDFKLFIREKEHLNYSGAIFDLDNTLYSYPACDEYARRVLFIKISGDFRISVSDVEKAYNKSRQYVHRRLSGMASMHSRFLYIQKTLELISGTTSIAKTIQYYELFRKLYLSQMKPFKWVKPLFEELYAHHIKIAILTDLTAEFQFQKIIRLHLASYISHVCTSEEIGKEKPARETLSAILRKIKCRPSEIFVVGDNPYKDNIGKYCGIHSFII